MDNNIKAAVDLFVSTVAKYKKQAEQQGVQIGQIQGDYVVANGQQYSFNSVSDRYLENGSIVTVSVDNNTNKAVILG